MGFIYLIVNPKGKLYVGQTYNISHRIASHKCASKNGGSAVILHNSIKKYGWEAHKLEVIETVDDSKLDEREIHWISTLDTYVYKNKMGMNMTIGGGGNRGTWLHDIERRKRASDYFSGDKNPFYGRKHTAESKAKGGLKISKINKEKGQTVPKWGADKGHEATRKPIIAYGKNGLFIGEYISLTEAAKILKLSRKNITSVLTKVQIHTQGVMFRYKSQNYPMVIDVSGLVFKKTNIPVLLLDKYRNVIKEYASAKEAAVDLNIPSSNIQRAAKDYKGKPIRSGHIFIYKEDYEYNQVTNN